MLCPIFTHKLIQFLSTCHIMVIYPMARIDTRLKSPKFIPSFNVSALLAFSHRTMPWQNFLYAIPTWRTNFCRCLQLLFIWINEHTCGNASIVKALTVSRDRSIFEIMSSPPSVVTSLIFWHKAHTFQASRTKPTPPFL